MYVCKIEGCIDTVSEHLEKGDLDCIGDNREAVTEFALAADALKEAVAVFLASAPATSAPVTSLAEAFAAYEAVN
jgi:hypothetical protein